jgi:hypothetical protein
MKTPRKMTVALALCGSLFLVSVVLAAPVTTVDRYVFGGGGGHAEAGLYALDGTIGQAVGGAALTGPYDLCSGFWCGIDIVYVPSQYLYLPLVLRRSH